MKIRKMLRKGYLKRKQDGEKNEKKKLGLFRGGSSGHYDEKNDEWRGQCPRKSLLRYHGIQLPIDYTSAQNFVAGLFHETNLIELMHDNPDVKGIEIFDLQSFLSIKTGNKKLKLHKNSLEYQIADGVKVSCRPDLIITEKDDTKFGIEAKSTVSEDKAYHSSFTPFVYAVCQAALYKLITGLEYYLVYGNYTNYGQFHSKWGTYCENMEKTYKNGQKKKFKDVCPHYKAPYEHLQDIEVRQFATGNYYKINCQQVAYKVMFMEDKIFLQDDYGNIKDTGLTVSGITRYYTKLKECIDSKSMPGRPNEMELYGAPKYSGCQYCTFNETCKRMDQRQLSYTQFIEVCRGVAEDENTKVEEELKK